MDKTSGARLSPGLARWCAGSADERRTAVVRPRSSTDIEEAVAVLERNGVAVQSAGAGAITVVVSPRSLAWLAGLPWVLAVEEPRALFATSFA